MKSKILILICVLCFSSNLFAKEVPSGGEMFVDVILARPLGFVAIGVGVAVFAVGLVFTIPSDVIVKSGSIKNSFNRLVVPPLSYTLVRPLGDYPGYMEEMQQVKE